MKEKQINNSFKHVLWDLTKFSIPLILSGILQQLYNWVDAFILGNVEGELALGAIGGTGTVTGFFILAITGFAVGIAVLAGQKYGEGDIPYIGSLLRCFAKLTAILFGVLTLISLLFVRQFLALLHTPADIFPMSESYLKIILIGIPFLAVYNIFSAVIRGVGDSKGPFYSVLASSAINVILDIILVAVLKKGIQGAAAATVFSQIAMTVFLIGYSRRKHSDVFCVKSDGSDQKRILFDGLRLGIPPMIQSCITASGNLILQNFMNSFGTATVVAITTAYRIDTLAMLPLVNFGSAISTLTAQGVGAKNKERIRMIRKTGVLAMIAVSVILTVLVIPFGSKLIALFGAGEEAVQIGHRFFVGLASFYVVFGIMNSLRGYLEGLGDVLAASVIGLITLGTRIIGSYLLVGVFDNMVIAYAEAIAWMLGLILFMLRIGQYEKKKRGI